MADSVEENAVSFAPDVLLAERLEAVDLSMPGLDNAPVVVASGSLVAGFGNPASDTDLYVIGDAEMVRDMSLVVDTSGFYEDLEFHTFDGIDKAWGTLEQAVADPWRATNLKGALELIRRLDIGVCLKGGERFALLRSGFDADVMRRASVSWACAGIWDRLARLDLEDITAGSHDFIWNISNWVWELAFAHTWDNYPTAKWRAQRISRARSTQTELAAIEYAETATTKLAREPERANETIEEFLLTLLKHEDDSRIRATLGETLDHLSATPVVEPISGASWSRCGHGAWHCVSPSGDSVWTIRSERRPTDTSWSVDRENGPLAVDLIEAGLAVLRPNDNSSVSSANLGSLRSSDNFASDLISSRAAAVLLVAFERDASGALDVGQDHLLRSACFSMLRAACRAVLEADGRRVPRGFETSPFPAEDISRIVESIKQLPPADVLTATTNFVESDLGVIWPDVFNGRVSAFALEQTRLKRVLKKIGREGRLDAVLDSRNFVSGTEATGEVDLTIREQR